VKVLRDSLHQILACENHRLGERFYENFFTAQPAAREFFRETNLEFQAHILLNSLQMIVALAEHNFPAAKSYLKVVGHRHFQRQIPPELFPPFRDALLATLREFHAETWNSELAKCWNVAIDNATAAMMQGYTSAPVTY
jgi:hemoglobin-like flavoprotein